MFISELRIPEFQPRRECSLSYRMRSRFPDMIGSVLFTSTHNYGCRCVILQVGEESVCNGPRAEAIYNIH